VFGQLETSLWDNTGQTRHGGLGDHSTGLGIPGQFRSSYNGYSDRMFSRGGINSEAIEPQGLHDFSIVLSMMSGKQQKSGTKISQSPSFMGEVG
jgi:hypothetical protein